MKQCENSSNQTRGAGGDSSSSLATATERPPKSASVLRDPFKLFPSLQLLWPLALLLLTLSLYWGL